MGRGLLLFPCITTAQSSAWHTVSLCGRMNHSIPTLPCIHVLCHILWYLPSSTASIACPVLIPDSGLNNATCFGQWAISRHDDGSRGLKWACSLNLASCASITTTRRICTEWLISPRTKVNATWSRGKSPQSQRRPARISWQPDTHWSRSKTSPEQVTLSL